MVGLRWKKCDFHLHTMESACYTAKDTPDQWIDAAAAKGLQCIAVTDHNNYKAIDSISELGKARGITVFPGVEVTCDSSKIHILCLFDTNCSGDKVRDFLARIRIDSDLVGKSEGCTEQSVFDVCTEAKKYGALVIAAHIDDFSGISQLSPDAQQKILSRKYLDAVQIVNSDIWENFRKDKDKAKLRESLNAKYGREIPVHLSEQWRKIYDKAQESKMPMVAGSDNPCGPGEAHHGLWGIGNRYTWIKMEDEPVLEGLRQAFLSSDTRIVLDSESESIPENDPEYWIKSVNLNKSHINPYVPVNVEFNPQL
ncbi:MAG: PHP domain-containing protein, partial [Bacillus sp. (in: firmicutes)]